MPTHRRVLAARDDPLVGTVLNLVPTKEVYGGQPYRYDTYRNRSERRRQREQPESTEQPGAHLAGLHGNGAVRPQAPSPDLAPAPEDGTGAEASAVADDAR